MIDSRGKNTTFPLADLVRQSVYSRLAGYAEHWDDVLLPEIERQQQQGKDVVVCADAAFAKPELYEALEQRGVQYAIRIPANDSLGGRSRRC